MADAIKQLTPRVSVVEDLCEVLARRCRDPNIAWPYHPRSGDLGECMTDALLRSLRVSSQTFDAAVRSGTVLIQKNKTVGGARRRKRLDLAFLRPETNLPMVAVEAKACMTAHAKAHTRLVAELTSSLDALLDANPRAKFFALVAINYGEKFTSPLNLPGPNRHAEKAGPKLAEALLKSLSNSHEICGTLVLPIRFDNERVCEPIIDAQEEGRIGQEAFQSRILDGLELRAV